MKKILQILVSFVSLAACVALVAFLSLAWFSANLVNNSGLNGVIANAGISIDVKYFNTDKSETRTKQLCPYIRSDLTATYDDSYFFSLNEITDALQIVDSSPLTTYTFSITFSNGSANSNVSVYIPSFVIGAQPITAYTAKDKTTPVSVDLLDSFYFFAKAASLTTTANSYLKTDTYSNLFSKDNYTYDSINLTYNFNELATKTNVITLDANGTGKAYFSLIFSNEASTFYSFDETDSQNPFWYKDINGNSNIYKNLTMVISAIKFVIE